MLYSYLDPREEAIKSFYITILGREADEAGLSLYMSKKWELESIYASIYTSDEAEKRRAAELRRASLKRTEGTLPITLAMFVKDAEESVGMAIDSVKDIVKEIVVVDTGSNDSTVSICESLGARVYKVGFSDFGSIRTITGHLAREEFVLGLDSDETLEFDYDVLKEMISDTSVDIWGLPRKRWLDLDKNVQLEEDVYPDYQYRLFRNDPKIYYVRRVHEVIEGSGRRKEAPESVYINHFQDSFKRGEKLLARNEMYKYLYDLDLKEGVEHSCPAVAGLDEV